MFRTSDKSVRLVASVKERSPERFAEVKAGRLSLSRLKKHYQRVKHHASAPESFEWYTPPRYIKAARKVLGAIDLDPASCEEANKTVGASKFYAQKQNGLRKSWSGRVWLNPPYGGLAPKFVKRLLGKYQTGHVTAAILLVNAHATDTAWFQSLWNHTLCFTNHRLNFGDAGGRASNASTHGSVFVYLGPKPRRFARVFSKFGAVVRRWPLMGGKS